MASASHQSSLPHSASPRPGTGLGIRNVTDPHALENSIARSIPTDLPPPCIRYLPTCHKADLSGMHIVEEHGNRQHALLSPSLISQVLVKFVETTVRLGFGGLHASPTGALTAPASDWSGTGNDIILLQFPNARTNCWWSFPRTPDRALLYLYFFADNCAEEARTHTHAELAFVLLDPIERANGRDIKRTMAERA